MITKTVLKVVLAKLREAQESGDLRGIKFEEIGILPEGRVPFSQGQRWLVVHPTSFRDSSIMEGDFRKRKVFFSISIVQRIRDIPNDRFDTIAYMDQISMSDILEMSMEIVERQSTMLFLREELTALNSKYSVNEQFLFLNGTLDPVHLYPSFFGGNTEDDITEKIAGYRMTFNYSSPLISAAYPACGP